MDNELLKNIELIEDYVEGNLSIDELQRFELALTTDIKLQEELALYKILVAGIRSKKEDEIRKKLIEIDHELDATAKVLQIKSYPNRKYFPLIAASVTILLLAGGVWLYRANYSKQALIDKYTLADPGLPVLMGVNENHEVDEVMNLYKLKKYNESFAGLNKLLIKNKDNDTLNYYAGVLLLQLNKPREAVNYFQNVSLKKESIFIYEAEYRLGLTFWEINENAKAKEIFKKISNSNSHLYRNNAELILKEL